MEPKTGAKSETRENAEFKADFAAVLDLVEDLEAEFVRLLGA